jgi:hypothetical protein
MNRTYTQFQVMDALTRQGYSPEQAESMAAAMGDMRVGPSQVRAGYRAVGAPDADLPMGRDGRVDSTFMPNLADGLVFAGASNLMERKWPTLEGEDLKNKGWLGNKPRTVGKIAGIGLASNLANLGYMGLSGNNFYDRASGPQMAADLGGNIAGGMAGEAAMKAIAKKASLALAGRAGGAALGSALGPIGMIAGTTLGGWLLPKLIPGGSKEVAKDTGREPSDFAQYAPLAGLAAGGGLLYSRRGKNMLGKLIKRKDNKIISDVGDA